MDGFDYGDPGSDPSSGGYDLNSWTGTGGMYVLPGEGGGERADTGLTVPTDDSGYIGETGLPPGVTPGTPGIGWGLPGNFGTFLTDLQAGTSGLGGALKGIFGGKYGDVTQLAAFGGLAALLNKMLSQKPDPVGYQGGIPQYTVTRTQTPMAQQRPVSYESITPREGEMSPAVMRQVPYRPGQGGITYFNPIQYNYTGRDLAAPTLAAPPTGGTAGGGANNGKVDTGGSSVLPDNIDFTMPVKNPTGTTGGDSNIQKLVDAGLADPMPKNFGPTGPMAEGIAAAAGGYMPGGIAMLAGGRYLRGPGDGVSDSIPAKFERSGQPARLADGEFVIDARTVSEIGNGSSEAGARKLYAMMDRVHRARKTAKRGKPSGADKYLPK